MTQDGLEDNFDRLRNYLLSQVGRRTGMAARPNENIPNPDASQPTPMDIGPVFNAPAENAFNPPAETAEHELHWANFTGKGRRGKR